MSDKQGPTNDGLVVAADLTPEPVKWLWPNKEQGDGRIPRGMVAVVAGKPDMGKGLFGVRVAADVSKRGENVLYSAQEDDPIFMTRPRLEAAGADLERVFLFRFHLGPIHALPDQIKRLHEKIIAEDIALIVMDPFNAHIHGLSRQSDNIRRVTGPLSAVAEATGCSILIVEHMLKNSSMSSTPLAAIGGNGSGLPAAARMAFLFGRDPKDETVRWLAPVKSNIRRKPKTLAFEVDDVDLDTVDEIPYLLAQGEVDVEAEALLEKKDPDATPGRPPTKRAQAAEWLSLLLYKAGKPVLARDIMEDARQDGGPGLTKSTLHRAAREMGVVKTPPNGGRNCTWELPDEVVKLIEDAAKAEGSKS